MTSRYEPVPDTPMITRPLAIAGALFAGLFRLTPYLVGPFSWNAMPIGGLCLFSGGRIRSWPAFAIPLSAMVVSDAAISSLTGFPILHSATPFVYLSFLGYVLLGRWLCQGGSVFKIPVAAMLGSMQFFVITNFGTWLSGIGPDGLPYAKTWSGLALCFENAVPFFRGTLEGDLAFTLVFFGLHAALVYWQLRRSLARVHNVAPVTRTARDS